MNEWMNEWMEAGEWLDEWGWYLLLVGDERGRLVAPVTHQLAMLAHCVVVAVINRGFTAT